MRSLEWEIDIENFIGILKTQRPRLHTEMFVIGGEDECKTPPSLMLYQERHKWS